MSVQPGSRSTSMTRSESMTAPIGTCPEVSPLARVMTSGTPS